MGNTEIVWKKVNEELPQLPYPTMYVLVVMKHPDGYTHTDVAMWDNGFFKINWHGQRIDYPDSYIAAWAYLPEYEE